MHVGNGDKMKRIQRDRELMQRHILNSDLLSPKHQVLFSALVAQTEHIIGNRGVN
ncbi:MAG: hypothetical protein Hyperionvirus27_21 [Hyperionvirus sp.]|uniref:Uncharacterized protein n=1 Tax=Hyperionvirus sp. TaxID=2487770 RepID=A0A3G5ADZ5_9VIRU|nr:MAG: hypothetical protein Hyperionvirus27_21 [Hyperionvirus sp.]